MVRALLTLTEALFLAIAATGVFLLAGVGAALLFSGAAGVLACEWLSTRGAS